MLGTEPAQPGRKLLGLIQPCLLEGHRKIDVPEHPVDRSHRLVGKQATGPAQPSGRERRLAAHREHAAKVERLRRGPVEVP